MTGAAGRIGIAGAGRMGVGLAVACAYAGERVALLDLKRRTDGEAGTVLRRAAAGVEASVRMLLAAGVISDEQAAAILARVTVRARPDSRELAGAEIVFEAVPEVLDAKREALELIGEHAAGSIVASTTSSFAAGELAALAPEPERFLCTHWLNPAYLIPLVEVSAADVTERATVQATLALLERLGKVPVQCASSPGYIVPRIQSLAMNEAARLADEGVASPEAIDTATRVGFGVRFAILGLLEFIDWGGADILHHASDHLAAALHDDRFAPADVIIEHMRDGATGMRAGRGFTDFSGRDLDAYQRETIARLAGLLAHLGLLRPPVG